MWGVQENYTEHSGTLLGCRNRLCTFFVTVFVPGAAPPAWRARSPLGSQTFTWYNSSAKYFRGLDSPQRISGWGSGVEED